MLKKRLIPVLLLQNGLLVRSETFSTHQIIGNPLQEVRRFNEWAVDELIYLDITRDDVYGNYRRDQKDADFQDPLQILDRVSEHCFMPLTWGGRIRSLDDVAVRIQRGADKVAINSMAFNDPDLVSAAARRFGSQAIVVGVDARRHESGLYEVFIGGAREGTGRSPARWAKFVEDLGAGEILLQSIDRDGTARGYDVDLIAQVVDAVSIPVIACGGVGTYEHYAAGIAAGASAVAAANIWHFKEMADRGARKALKKKGINIR